MGLLGTKVISNLPWQPILGKIGKMTYIPQAGVSKLLAIWLFRFKNIQWLHCVQVWS